MALKIGMRDLPYVDRTPELSVGDSAFEDWFQAHQKACTGDKQLARDAYAAGMGDPVAYDVVYQKGLAEGIRMYAHWKSGVQYVGTCGTTLEQALKNIKTE